MATVNFGYNALGQRAAYTSTTTGHAELAYAAHLQYRDGQLAQAVIISGTATGSTTYSDTYIYDQGGNPLELFRARSSGVTDRYWYVLDGRGNNENRSGSRNVSYRLILLKPKPGVDPVSSAKALLRRSARATKTSNQNAEPVRRRLINAVLQVNPLLQTASDAEAGVEINPETLQRRSEDLALSHDITLYDSPEKNNFEITFTNDIVFITVHFGSGLTPDNQIINELQGYLQAIQHEEGYAIYDPQAESMIDVDGNLSMLSL